MNAKEARAKASSISIGKNKQQYDEIKNAINEAVNEGKMNVDIYFVPTKWVIEKLKEEYFAVNTLNIPKNEVITTIAW